MELGNSYLELYKAIRTVCFEPSCITKEEVLNFQTKISELDKKSTNLPISFIGRYWAKRLIEKEMDLSWIRKYE